MSDIKRRKSFQVMVGDVLGGGAAPIVVQSMTNTYTGVSPNPDAAKMNGTVMGCVENGPGEFRNANIGISLPGTFEEPKAPVYVDGEHYTTLRGDDISREFREILDDYVVQTYGKTGNTASTNNKQPTLDAHFS